MKKHFYLLLFMLFIISCKKSEEPAPSNKLTPPDWIQGSWTYHGNQTWEKLNTVLTSDNVVLNLFGNTSDLRTFPDKRLDGYSYALSEPTKTSKVYEVKVTYLGQKDTNLFFYRWTKLDATHILFYRKSGLNNVFELTFDKD